MKIKPVHQLYIVDGSTVTWRFVVCCHGGCPRCVFCVDQFLDYILNNLMACRWFQRFPGMQDGEEDVLMHLRQRNFFLNRQRRWLQKLVKKMDDMQMAGRYVFNKK